MPFFAGRLLAQGLPGGHLLHCTRCDLRFRFPSLDDAACAALYDNQAVTTWSVSALREDQRLVQSVVQSAAHTDDASEASESPFSVLDFGCYTGDMLALLPAAWAKFGVEVNRSAGDMAASRTNACVTNDLDGFPDDLCFDLIIAMDVIEHVLSPRALMQRLAARLKPGGRLVITTGDGANWLWRLVGPRWWYCYYPEHIAFISARWLAHHARGSGLQLVQARSFNYHDRTGKPWYHGWRGFVRYLLLPAWYRTKQRQFRQRHGNDLGVPGIGLVPDHLLAVLVRPRNQP